jgi:outer membrane protein assembly factor BamE (lipoprotein component of BamABCDE complex)
MLAGASCSHKAPPAAVLDAGKVASVVVGRSSRTDVFAALGQPNRTERSALGEAWVYEARTEDAGDHSLMSGASAATGVVGAFVPYVGLIGSGLGLAGAAMDGMHAEPQAVMLAVTFRDDGVVRDCTYSSTAAPPGVTGSATDAARPVDCQRPAASAARAL